MMRLLCLWSCTRVVKQVDILMAILCFLIEARDANAISLVVIPCELVRIVKIGEGEAVETLAS
jgi:hypothetical protein